MEQYIRINKLLCDTFGQHIKFNGVVKFGKSPIDEFYDILNRMKNMKIMSNLYGAKFKEIDENKELFGKVTNCNNFEQVFMLFGGYTEDNFKLIDNL